MTLFELFSKVINAQASSQVHLSAAFCTAFTYFSLLSSFLMYLVGDLPPFISNGSMQASLYGFFLALRCSKSSYLFIHIINDDNNLLSTHTLL